MKSKDYVINDDNMLVHIGSGIMPNQPLGIGGIGALFDDLTLNDEVVEKMTNAKFLIPNVIVEGSVSVFAAPANGGKSALFRYFCELLCKSEKIVLYVNSDAGASDLKKHYEHSKKHKYKVIAPDARAGKSANDVTNLLKDIAKSDASCKDYVFILDTLKKFTDVISKSQAKEFYKLLRALTVKGATICLLGHCNKYKDENGQHIYEGTADLRNDIDNLIYFDSFLNEQTNILEVTTRPDKTRAEFHPVSFHIDKNNNLKVTPANEIINIIPADDREIIDTAKAAINAGFGTQGTIIDYVKDRLSIGDKKIKSRLTKYSNTPNIELIKTSSGTGRGVRYEIV